MENECASVKIHCHAHLLRTSLVLWRRKAMLRGFMTEGQNNSLWACIWVASAGSLLAERSADGQALMCCRNSVPYRCGLGATLPFPSENIFMRHKTKPLSFHHYNIIQRYLKDILCPRLALSLTVIPRWCSFPSPISSLSHLCSIYIFQTAFTYAYMEK